MDLRLSGYRALVTGAHRGTGNIIARQLAAEGVAVWLHGFDLEVATIAAAEITGARPVAGDITTDSGAAAVLAEIAAAPPQILINNYGTADRGTWDTADTDSWLDAYHKNVLSAQRLIRGLLGQLRMAGWGRIINLGTVGSSRPNAVMPHYYAAKAALANFTIGLAKEVAGTGIGVNLVSPGLILTPEVEAAYFKSGIAKGWGSTWAEIEAHLAKDIPLGRITRREEVADLVCFLASPRADAIHGQNIRIDGGALGTLT